MKRTILRECIRLAWEKDPGHPYAQMNKRKKHYSFIVYKNKIIAVGMNRPKDGFVPIFSHYYGELEKSELCGRHSEPDAFNKAKGLLCGDTFEIVNIRISNRKISISKPCPCCCTFLQCFGCKEVWFTTGAGFAKLKL